MPVAENAMELMVVMFRWAELKRWALRAKGRIEDSFPRTMYVQVESEEPMACAAP